MNQYETYRGRDAQRAVGEAVVWILSAFIHFERIPAPLRLSGRVVYVNAAHRYYTVEAPCNGYVIRESFIF